MNTQPMHAQPKALTLLNFVSMWECFSYYGMRALLVLFMTEAMLLSDREAFGLYALYTSLLELGGVVGGIAADRYLGLRRCITLGGWTILIGHVCLSCVTASCGFYLGLALIVVGTGLFRSNVAALLGRFYTKDDPRREAGYTLYYTGINIGGFLASLVCGTVGELYGWHAGFGLAALGMLLGNIALLLGHNLIADVAKKDAPDLSLANIKGFVAILLITPICGCALLYHGVATMIFPFLLFGVAVLIFRALKGVIEAHAIKRLLTCVGLMVIFYGCEEQLGSTLVLFAERHVDRQLFSYTVPASSLIMFNPLTILIAGPLLSRWLQRLKMRDMSKICISFALLGSAFGMLYLGCQMCNGEEMVPLAIAIGSIICIALGEILIGPTVYAAGAAIAPPTLQGITMGLVTLGFALANLFSGFLSQSMAIDGTSNSFSVYSEGFALIGYTTLGVSVLLLLLTKLKKGNFAYAAH